MKELLLTIDVKCSSPLTVKGSEKAIVIIPFCGNAHGEDFNGKIIGQGTDMQKYDLISGENSIIARYILQGIDKTGAVFRIFIENVLYNNNEWRPTIITDSKYLGSWEKLPLTASVTPTADGVNVNIYKET